jgi:hypothetical protein
MIELDGQTGAVRSFGILAVLRVGALHESEAVFDRRQHGLPRPGAELEAFSGDGSKAQQRWRQTSTPFRSFGPPKSNQKKFALNGLCGLSGTKTRLLGMVCAMTETAPSCWLPATLPMVCVITKSPCASKPYSRVIRAAPQLAHAGLTVRSRPPSSTSAVCSVASGAGGGKVRGCVNFHMGVRPDVGLLTTPHLRGRLRLRASHAESR